MIRERGRAQLYRHNPVQLSTGGTPGKRTLTEQLPSRPSSAGDPLPQGARGDMERSFGESFADVRIHENDSPAAHGALAYTQGSDIHFAPGQYQPNSGAGRELLGHELTHVVQQRAGRADLPQGKDGVNADPGLEREADQLGAAAARGEEVRVPGASGGTASGAMPKQRKVDPQAILGVAEQDKGIGRVLELVLAYNEQEPDPEDLTQKQLHAQMARLDEIEHAIYAWYNEIDDTVDPSPMIDLLDEVQREHKVLVARTVENDFELWVHEEGDGERESINAVWSDLLDGSSGAFRMQGMDQEWFQAFRIDVLAMIARLMSRPKGRALLTALHDKGSRDEHMQILFGMVGKDRILGAEPYNEPYVGANATSFNDNRAMLRAVGEDGIEGGPGVGSRVELSPGVRDGAMMDFDRHRSPILSPAFIGVGHELIHSSHYQRGTYVGGRSIEPRAKLPRYEDDVEEAATIAPRSKYGDTEINTSVPNKEGGGSSNRIFSMGRLHELNKGLPTEAEIRGEHGLGIREGHTTTANPLRYKGATSDVNPSTFVEDSKQWVKEHIREDEFLELLETKTNAKPEKKDKSEKKKKKQEKKERKEKEKLEKKERRKQEKEEKKERKEKEKLEKKGKGKDRKEKEPERKERKDESGDPEVLESSS